MKRKAKKTGQVKGSDVSDNPPKTDLYQTVTDKIVAELEAGCVPWVRPWSAAHAGCAVGLPQNAVSRKSYSGINILILWGAVIEQGFPCQNWLTFKQARDLGGSVRKGEKGQIVCYVDRFTPESERQKARDQGRDAESVAFLKRYVVFNAAQCDGLPDDLVAVGAPIPECEQVPEAEALVIASRADMRVGGARAFYVPSQDFVQMPPHPAFHEPINYYRTLFHELGHWTGHQSRLDRDMSGRFGTKPYAQEELVAELSAAFVCATLGIVPTVRHADYIGSWLQVLREDKRAIFRAASHASKAADHLLAFRNQDAEAAA